MKIFFYFRYMLIFIFLSAGIGRMAADDEDEPIRNWQLRINSLKQSLNQPLPEKRKMEVYLEIADVYGNFEPDSSIVYAHKTREIAVRRNDSETLIDISISMGVTYIFKSNYDSAHFYFDKSKELAVKHGNKEKEIVALSLIAFTYAKQGKYITATDYFLKVLKMSENAGETERYVMASINISEINRRLGNTETAIQYLKQAEKKCNQFGENNSNYIWRIPHIYNEYAFNYLDRGNPDEALRYALKADSINLPDGVINRCYSKGLLATIYLRQNDCDRALQYAKKSFSQAEILKDKNLYAYAGKILSDVYLAQKRYSEAEAEALKVWQADSTNIDEARDVVLNIALANIYMHNTEKAVYYLNKYSDLNARYSEKSFQNTISDLAVKYEIEKKDLQISSLEKQKILYIIIGIVGISPAIIIGIFSLQKVRRELLEKQLIATNAILEWEEKERKRFASDLHDGINGMLSALKIELDTTEHHIHNTAGNKLDECIETIRRMAHDMMPASLERFGMKAALEDHCRLFPNVHFHFFGEDRRVDKKIELVVFYCTHELVNNSTKHSGAKNINVQLIQAEKRVSLTVHDDGCGFNLKSILRGSGLKSINNRVISCNGKIDIASSPDNGTETIIELKIEN